MGRMTRGDFDWEYSEGVIRQNLRTFECGTVNEECVVEILFFTTTP